MNEAKTLGDLLRKELDRAGKVSVRTSKGKFHITIEWSVNHGKAPTGSMVVDSNIKNSAILAKARVMQKMITDREQEAWERK